MKKKTKTLILSVVITLILLLTFTVSYALFAYQETGTKNNQLVMGDIWMSFNESNGIDLSGAMPGDDYSKYFEFNIKGRNTYTERDIYYEILLSRGEKPDDKEEINRIPDEYLNFKLVEVNNDDSETIIFTDKSYSNIANKIIHIETIPRNQTEEYNKTYRLYMVINDKLTLGNTDNAVMTTQDYQKAFASVKVNVLGDFEEKELPKNFVSLIKSKPDEDGLVAINTDGNLYDGTGEIREYRYSGLDVNNYVFFDTNADGIKTDDEIWRIVGVFKDPIKDSNGEIVLDSNNNPTYEEKIKLVRNTILTSDELAEDYYIGTRAYTISYTTDSNSALWNSLQSGINYNDWTTAGLQYYLNTEHDETDTSNGSTANLGYLSFFRPESKRLLSLTTYYLGNVTRSVDTVKNAYVKERSEMDKWDGNELIWNGFVGLMYASDYGYSANNSYWETRLADLSPEIIESWMYQLPGLRDRDEWLLTPTSTSTSDVMTLNLGRYDYGQVNYYDFSIRPTISLISDANIIDAPGTLEDPYVVVIE